MPKLTITPAALDACANFSAEHDAPINAEQIEAVVAESLDNLFALFADER